MTEDSLKTIKSRAERAAKEARIEDVFGDLNGGAHYVVGLLGVVGGAVAAAKAGDGNALAGIAAAAGSGALTLFSFKERSASHYLATAALRSVAEYAENEYARLTEDPARRTEAPDVLREIQRRLDFARTLAARIPSGAECTGQRNPDDSREL